MVRHLVRWVWSEALLFLRRMISSRVFFGSVNENCDRSLSSFAWFRLVFSGRLSPMRSFSDLPYHFLQKMFANLSEAFQRKHMHYRGVNVKTIVSNCLESKLTPDDLKRMLNLCPVPGFDSLCCVSKWSRGLFQIQFPPLSWHYPDL